MSAPWPIRKLGEVCDVARGKTITRKQAIEGDVPVVAGGIKSSYTHNVANRPANVITVSGSGANAGFVNFWPVPIFASDCSTIIPLNSEELDVNFLYYAMLNLQDYISTELRRGAAQPHVYAKDIALLEINVPPFEEQQRIVGILDEAFEKISDLTVNVQFSIDSMKELLESKLQAVFGEGSWAWEKIQFEQSIEKTKITPKIKRRDFKETGQFPIISQEMDFINGYWDNAADLLEIQRPVVVFGDHTRVLKYVDFAFVRGADGLKILQPVDSIYPKFFYHQLRSVRLNSLGYARHYRLLKQVDISVPSMEIQREISSMFDQLDEQVAEMIRLYEHEADSLKEVQNSVLQEAFSGRLTGGLVA